MDPVRVGVVRYLNTAPLMYGLEKLRGLTMVPAVPATIVSLIADGSVELGLASVVDAARSAGSGEPMALIPAGMIGCDGPTLTVRVFSRVPIAQITTVHADTDSHTSVVLCRLVLRELTGADPRMVGFDARERVERGGGGVGGIAGGTGAAGSEHPETLLLIGDKVVTDGPEAVRYPHQLDLGEAWKAMTGLPFVYAMWMARASMLDDPRVALVADLLDRQRRHNRTRIDAIVSARAPEHRWPIDLARRYLGELLRYEVGPRERAAVSEFLRRAATGGLLPSGEPLWGDAALERTRSRELPASGRA